VAELVEEFSFSEYAIDDSLSRLRWIPHPLCGWFEDTPLKGGTCNDLITSDALLDYITGFSLN
jgi:hypothetical protein